MLIPSQQFLLLKLHVIPDHMHKNVKKCTGQRPGLISLWKGRSYIVKFTLTGLYVVFNKTPLK